MKVRELIKLLKDEDPDSVVRMAYNYGDHWRTTVAPEVKRVEESFVEFSGYHNTHKVVDLDESDAKMGDKQAGFAVVLFATAG